MEQNHRKPLIQNSRIQQVVDKFKKKGINISACKPRSTLALPSPFVFRNANGNPLIIK